LRTGVTGKIGFDKEAPSANHSDTANWKVGKRFSVFLCQVYDGFANTRDLNCRKPLLAINAESNRGEDRLNQIRADGREDLPVRPAMLTAGFCCAEDASGS